MLERMGVNTRGETLRTANVAAVMVTANLPPFSTQGSRIDVSVAAMGDASSLQGGTLLVTPLLGADGEAYAIAQGPVLINGFSAQGEAATVISGVPTTGMVSSGGLIEREINFALGAQHSVRLSLRNPDLTTSRRIALAINDLIGLPVAIPTDPANVRLSLPNNFNGNIVDLLTDIEQLVIQTDQAARKAEHSDDLAARTFEEVGELGQRGIEGGIGPGKGGTGAGQRHAGGKNVVAAASPVGRALLDRKGSLGGHGWKLRGLNISQRCVRCMFFPLPGAGL